MHTKSYLYKLLLKAPLMGLLLLFSSNVFSQTNEKTKDKEIKQIKEINKDYDRAGVKKKREDYLTQTREQRLGTTKDKIKGKSKGKKETEYINNTAAQRSFKGKQKNPKNATKSLAKEIKNNSSGNINAGTPQEREYKQVTNNKGARDFSGNSKNVESKYKAENTKNMGSYSGDKNYQSKGEKEANYINRTKGQRDYQGNVDKGGLSHLAKREENKKVMQKYASGDQKYQTKGEKEAAYINRTKGQRDYQGNVDKGGLSHLAKREENKKEMQKYASGDLKYQTKGEKETAYLNRTKGQRNFQGTEKVSDFEFLKKREENKKEMQKYASGDLKYMTKGQRDEAYLERTSAMRSYQGNIDRGNLSHLIKRAEVKDEMEKYSSGDIEWRDLEKREKQRREKAKKIAQFSGSVLVRDIEKWQKSIRKKEKDIANFQGNIKIDKRKKGQHPSAAYKGGFVANSYTQKARMRKKMLKKYGRKSDIDMPAHLKDKQKKAKYSKDESEIWW